MCLTFPSKDIFFFIIEKKLCYTVEKKMKLEKNREKKLCLCKDEFVVH